MEFTTDHLHGFILGFIGLLGTLRGFEVIPSPFGSHLTEDEKNHRRKLMRWVGPILLALSAFTFLGWHGG